MKIGFLIIGTNKYLDMALECAKSIKEFVKIEGAEVDCLIFTNKIDSDVWEQSSYIKQFYIDHLPWPLITLLRYNIFLRFEEELHKYDYLYYIDADMRLVAPISNEILPRIDNDISALVGTIHPGFYNKPKGAWTYERNPKSKAVVKEGEGEKYYIGAFQGGETQNFLDMCYQLDNNIRCDLQTHNFIACWHDESHMNRYFIDNPPSISLSPSYCCPENWNLPFEKKIIALDKNQKEIRA